MNSTKAPSNKPVRALGYTMRRNEQTGQATTTVMFNCPNCSKRHTIREIYSHIPAPFETVGRSLRCGPVRIAMPWAKARGVTGR